MIGSIHLSATAPYCILSPFVMALLLRIYNYSFVEESEGTPLSPNSIIVQLSTNDLNCLKASWYKCQCYIDNCRVKSNHGCVWKSCSTNRHQQCNCAININRKLSYLGCHIWCIHWTSNCFTVFL